MQQHLNVSRFVGVTGFILAFKVFEQFGHVAVDARHVAQRRVEVKGVFEVYKSDGVLVDTVCRSGLDILLDSRITKLFGAFPCLFIIFQCEKKKDFVNRRVFRYFLYDLLIAAVQSRAIYFSLMVFGGVGQIEK